MQEIIVDFSKDDVPTIQIEKIIPLETKIHCLIGSMSSIYVDSERIYILDNQNSKSVFLFSNKGEFLAKTNYGRGPNEMLEPIDFYVDTLNNCVLVWDQSAYKFFKFSLDLEFISSQKENLVLRNFTKLSDGSWLVRSEYFDYFNYKDNNPKVFFYYYTYSDDFKKIKSRLLPFDEKFMSISLVNPISKSVPPLFCTQFDMNLYTIQGNDVCKAYFINFNELALTNKIKEKTVDFIFEQQAKGMVVANIENIQNSSDYITFQYPLKKELHYVIYSINENKVYLSNNILKNKILPKGYIRSILNDNIFVLEVNPNDFMEYCSSKPNLLKKYKGIKAGDNSVLLFFKLIKK